MGYENIIDDFTGNKWKNKPHVVSNVYKMYFYLFKYNYDANKKWNVIIKLFIDIK